MASGHQAVLLDEAIQGLAISPDGVYVDGTFGRGGHSAAILDRLGVEGRLIAFDKDPEAVAAGSMGVFCDPRFCIVHDSFTALQHVIADHGLMGQVQGVLLDLGVSSPQIDDARRGFSFNKEGPLDMRMNSKQGMDAATWINRASEDDIRDVLYRYGEERYGRRLARAIITARGQKRIETTLQLSAILKAACPVWDHRIHPATRSFQAIRIFINQELDELVEVLKQSLMVLAPGGRLCVISFHSLEDRIVKRFIQQHAANDDAPSDLPIRHTETNRRLVKIGSLIRAGNEAVILNPRARSARLRIAEKIK